MARTIIVVSLVLITILGCTKDEPRYEVGEKAEKYEKEILQALFNASEQKIYLEACESHAFSILGEFLAEVFSSTGDFKNIRLLCPKEEDGNLFCEFNIDHGKDNTLVRFVYNKKTNRLLENFEPQCIRVP